MLYIYFTYRNTLILWKFQSRAENFNATKHLDARLFQFSGTPNNLWTFQLFTLQNPPLKGTKLVLYRIHTRIISYILTFYSLILQNPPYTFEESNLVQWRRSIRKIFTRKSISNFPYGRSRLENYLLTVHSFTLQNPLNNLNSESRLISSATLCLGVLKKLFRNECVKYFGYC